MRKTIFPILALVFFLSCGETQDTTDQVQPDETDCSQLDSLVNGIAMFRSSLGENGNIAQREVKLGEIIDLMDRNAVVEDDCNYLNTDLHPDHLRFDFVEGLRDWTIRDTFYQGIYYLLELRGAWSDDSAIYEFFSEEIARVAYENPHCYDGYLREQPGQVTMVLNTTRWSYQDLPEIKSKFAAIEAIPEIIEFLDQLKPNLP